MYLVGPTRKRLDFFFLGGGSGGPLWVYCTAAYIHSTELNSMLEKGRLGNLGLWGWDEGWGDGVCTLFVRRTPGIQASSTDLETKASLELRRTEKNCCFAAPPCLVFVFQFYKAR